MAKHNRMIAKAISSDVNTVPTKASPGQGDGKTVPAPLPVGTGELSRRQFIGYASATTLRFPAIPPMLTQCGRSQMPVTTWPQ